ncbi:MAG: glutamate-cysteine ligase family protein [Gaiellaceae bacterium]
MPGADRALAVYNGLRSYLPELAALGANSAFAEGHDTGMASVRPKFNDAYPRSGIPPALRAWDSRRSCGRRSARGATRSGSPSPKAGCSRPRRHRCARRSRSSSRSATHRGG